MEYVLGFDIGNTNTHLGIFEKSNILPVKTYRYRTHRNVTSDELGLLIKSFLNNFKNEINTDIHISGIAFSNVVTEVNNQYHVMSKKFFNLTPLEINSFKELGITLHYINPEWIGTDRIVNAVAAYNEYKKDCIVVDLGTAVTYDVVLKQGIFDGGLIGPGIGITIDALAENTSKLLKVDFQKMDRIVTQNPMDAIKSGFYYGWLSMITGILSKIEQEYNKEFMIIITGGYSDIIGKNIDKECTIDPLLTMKGIKYVYDMNCA